MRAEATALSAALGVEVHVDAEGAVTHLTHKVDVIVHLRLRRDSSWLPSAV